MQCTALHCQETTRRHKSTLYRWDLLCERCKRQRVFPDTREIERHRQDTIAYIKKQKQDRIDRYTYQQVIRDLEHKRMIQQMNKRLASIE